MKIGFLGFGNMAQALAEGFAATGALKPCQIGACARDRAKLRRNTEPKGFLAFDDAARVAEFADIVVRTTSSGEQIRLGDIAEVSLGSQTYGVSSSYESDPTAMIVIYQQPGSNAVAVGGNPDALAGVDNFCWCDPVQSEKTPDGRYKLAQLVRACKALQQFSLAFGVPCISGKDSMKNDYTGGGEKISIPPTVLFSVMGVINNVMSNHMFQLLEKQGVPTHFVEQLSERETLVKKVSIVPLEVIIRNISAGSFAKRFGVEEGIVFDEPTIEFSYKNDDLGDPLMNAYHAVALKAATREEIETIKSMAFKVNEVMKQYFDSLNVILVDFKLEFGKPADGKIVLADEISPDTCRLWDKTTKEKLDKDRFRRDLGGVEEAYQEIMKRVMGK